MYSSLNLREVKIYLKKHSVRKVLSCTLIIGVLAGIFPVYTVRAEALTAEEEGLSAGEEERSAETIPEETVVTEEEVTEETVVTEEEVTEEDTEEASVPTRSLKDVREQMDAPLQIAPAGNRRRLIKTEAASEPSVSIDKTARWLDIERGYAQIDLTERDSSAWSNQAVDYLIILDRTRTMSLNDRTFEGSPSGAVNSSHSPCLNRDHYYEYNGSLLDLYDYGNGIIRGTDQVLSLPLDAQLYNQHRNGSGAAVGVDYGNGCMDRLSIARETICGLIDRIADNSPAGTMKNRVSYWSFAGTYWPEQEGELDTDPEKGIFNYIPLTESYESVKQKVRETGTYAGTYYQESMKRAYEQLSSRTGSYKNAPSKVIFISDGKCSDDLEEVAYWNDRLKKIPGCTVYTLAVGMPLDSEGAVFLKKLSTNQDATTFAAFTTNLNSSDPAFAETLSAIEQAPLEVRAVNKVLTDRIDTRYWEFQEIISSDGTADCRDGVLTWNIPEGEGKTYRCSLKVKLKDEYRYLISDTRYPTNRDTDTEKGCNLTYEISGGPSHNQKRKQEAETPWLKYGALKAEGKKLWTVRDSSADSVRLFLKRALADEEGTEETLCEMILTASENWSYSLDRRTSGKETFPLVCYTNAEQKWRFWIEEEADSYVCVKEDRKEENGILRTNISNEPYKIKIQMEKRDADTKNLLSGAHFGVYAYSRQKHGYVPYQGTDDSISGETKVTLAEIRKGIYCSEQWLYYSPDNEGRFRILEDQAPEGYVGDYEDPETKKEKKGYDVVITKENTGTTVTKDVKGDLLCAENTRVIGKLKIYKKDADSHLGIPQGKASLFYENEEENAHYGLYAAEIICHPDGVTSSEGKETGVLFHKGDLAAEGRISSEGFLVFENLPLGAYYVKELDTAPEGYLLDDTEYQVRISWKSEDCPCVIVSMDVYEPVKKQSQVIYKIGGPDHTTEYTWIKDAGFTVFSLESLSAAGTGESLSEKTDEELLDYIDRVYRNPKTLTYEAMKKLPSVTLYEDGKAYVPGELKGENGVIRTPGLPYGDYVLVETTVPKNKRPVRPVVLRIREDEEDRERKGDQEGTRRPAKILRDMDLVSRVRIRKIDAATGEPVRAGQAGYVIHDVEGAWKEQYVSGASAAWKALYLLKYNGLVLEYDENRKVWRGTYDNPYLTAQVKENGKTVLEASTEKGIPNGLYELEEVTAPEGYILQGKEGRIARASERGAVGLNASNGTFYENRKNGRWTAAPTPRVRFSVDQETGMYDEAGDIWWTTVRQDNAPAIGKLSIAADAQQYEKDTDRKITVPQKHAEFELYTEKGVLVQKLTTNAEGRAWTGGSDNQRGEPEGLLLGTYRLVQTKQGEGFEDRKLPEDRMIRLSYENSETPVVYQDETYHLALEEASGQNTTGENSTDSRPKTGDRMHPKALMAMLAASAATLAGVRWLESKKHKQRRREH